jgi:hypothetical protein
MVHCEKSLGFSIISPRNEEDEGMSLPILSSLFFEKHPPDLGFFSKWKSIYTWNDQILPIYEWQDILYVACLQPPANFPKLPQNVVFLLCDHESLKNVWYSFEGTVITNPAPSSQSQPQSSSPPQSVAVSISAPEFKPDSLPGLAPQVEAEDGILKLDLNPITEEAKPSTSILEAPAIIQDTKVDEAPELLLQNNPEEELSEGEPASEEVSEELLDLSAGFETLGTSGSNPPPLISLQPLSSDSVILSTPTQTSVQIEAPPPSEEKRATPVKSEVLLKSDVTRSSVSALNALSQNEPGSWTDKLFSEMNSHFKKTMILVKSGDQVKPWKWDANFNPSTPSITSVTLLQPSPFRVVYRTHKAYHGFVVSNDLCQKFFAQWNSSEIPEHMTIAPVLIDDHVVGMLLGIGDKSADTKASLGVAEKLASTISQQINGAKKAA